MRLTKSQSQRLLSSLAPKLSVVVSRLYWNSAIPVLDRLAVASLPRQFIWKHLRWLYYQRHSPRNCWNRQLFILEYCSFLAWSNPSPSPNNFIAVYKIIMTSNRIWPYWCSLCPKKSMSACTNEAFRRKVMLCDWCVIKVPQLAQWKPTRIVIKEYLILCRWT